MKHPNTPSLSLKTSLYFALNPEAVLTSHDIARHFNTEVAELRGRLFPYVQCQLLTMDCGRFSTRNVYHAGPKLLELITDFNGFNETVK